MKRYIFVLSLLLILGTVSITTSVSAVNCQKTPNDPICQACNDPQGKTSVYCQSQYIHSETSTDTTLAKTIGKISTFIAYLGGTIAVIVVIYGGFRYVVSGGNEQKITTAKNTILYGVIGVVVIAISQALIIFVINALK